jgi:TRAP transporter TAXI family solute receptor
MMRLVICGALAMVLSACTRGPGEGGLRQDVQARVDALFGRQVLEVESFRRQGSAPYRAGTDGARQVIVYYNAIFRMTEAYDPSDWQGLGPTMIANAIGASDEGITGLKSGRNEPGTRLRAYGSIVYRAAGHGWQPADVVAPRPAVPVAAGGGVPKSEAEELMRSLATLVQQAPARRGSDDEIIAEELNHALAAIRLRMNKEGKRVVVAAGPAGGEYSRFLASVIGRRQGPQPITVAETAGSVENAMLIERNEARAGLVQSDVAAAAITGRGIFSGTGPLGHLRAVASLFPEPVHVVVRADSAIVQLSDLVGRRIALGRVASGTRQTAVDVLAAAGVGIDQVIGLEEPSPQVALDRLAAGEIDAVIEVVSAPWRQLEIEMHGSRLRLLPLDPETISRAVADVHGLLPLDIPARTYPGSTVNIPTVAATALLVARDDVPDAVVLSTLGLLYASAESGGVGVQATRLSKTRARSGITIPMHPAATRFFDGAAAGQPEHADEVAVVTDQAD